MRNKQLIDVKKPITQSLCDLIIAEEIGQAHYGTWQNCPFNIKFSARKMSSSDSKRFLCPAIYLISSKQIPLYLGKYQPKSGNIVRDRLVKHLSTISARGHRLSFGNEGRYEEIKYLIKNESLKENINMAFKKKYRSKYFRDSGHTTTKNRLRYADKNWNLLSKSSGTELIRKFSAHIFLLRIKDPQSSNSIISQLEKDILKTMQPVCNKEFNSLKTKLSNSIRTDKAVSIISRLISNQSKIHSWEYAKFT